MRPDWPKPFMEVIDVPEADRIEASAPTAPPRVIPIARPAGQPADVAPAPAKSKADPETQTAPTEEGDVRWRPNRVVARIPVHGTRPPSPAAAINEPAAVVVRRPAPWLVTNPRPSVVRLPDPAAVAIRSPAFWLVRRPHLSVVGNFRPRTVIVQVFRSGVIPIGPLPALSSVDPPIALVVPG